MCVQFYKDPVEVWPNTQRFHITTVKNGTPHSQAYLYNNPTRRAIQLPSVSFSTDQPLQTYFAKGMKARKNFGIFELLKAHSAFQLLL